MLNKYHFPPGNSRVRSLLASITFLKDPIGAISRNMAKFSGTYSTYLLGRKLILTEDPAFIEYILRENHTNYQKSKLSTETAARLFGSGLLFANGKSWLKQRRLIQPGFHHNKIQGLYEIVARTSAECILDFPTGEDIDIYPLMHKISFEVLIHSLFDIHLSEQTMNELSRGFTDLQDFLLKDINQPLRKIFYPINNAEKVILQKSKNIRRILKEIVVQRQSSDTLHSDLLDMLLNSRYEDTGEGMEEEQIIDEILVLLFAGHETTANTLSWLFYLIAGHPDVNEKLRTTISEITVNESPGNIYINAVISEAMRLYPAAWMTERVTLADDHFGVFSFPKDTIIIPFFYGLHRNKEFWSEESTFNPQRFISPDAPKGKKVKNFFPFGAGPRMCIGNNFAIAEMSFILHRFISTFEISSTENTPGMWPLITLRPRKVLLNIKRLKNPK